MQVLLLLPQAVTELCSFQGDTPETALCCTWRCRWAASNSYTPFGFSGAQSEFRLLIWTCYSSERLYSGSLREEKSKFKVIHLLDLMKGWFSFHPIPRVFRQCDAWNKLYGFCLLLFCSEFVLFCDFLMPCSLFHLFFLDKALDTLYSWFNHLVCVMLLPAL